LLKGISNRLSETIRTSLSGGTPKTPKAADLVARLAGDEFVILLEHISSEDEALKMVSALASSLKEDLIINNENYKIDCSIGIAMYPDDGSTTDALLAVADRAMYKYKKDHSNKT
jgi:diguanylate cyclase (GGDEF)-like protein